MLRTDYEIPTAEMNCLRDIAEILRQQTEWNNRGLQQLKKFSWAKYT